MKTYTLRRFVDETKFGEAVNTLESCYSEKPQKDGEMGWQEFHED